jgi:hypothetical protein
MTSVSVTSTFRSKQPSTVRRLDRLSGGDARSHVIGVGCPNVDRFPFSTAVDFDTPRKRLVTLGENTQYALNRYAYSDVGVTVQGADGHTFLAGRASPQSGTRPEDYDRSRPPTKLPHACHASRMCANGGRGRARPNHGWTRQRIRCAPNAPAPATVVRPAGKGGSPGPPSAATMPCCAVPPLVRAAPSSR